MPRERSDLFRVSNVKEKERIFVLAYEGNETEAIYFESLKDSPLFNNELIYLISLKRDKDDHNSAPKHVFSKLKREVKELYTLDIHDELWMIIDRDRWHNLQEICDKCTEEGNFYLALSNPCFEFWLLLHIKDINEFSSEELNSIWENRKVRNKTYLKKLLSDLLDNGYNESNPQPERFLPYLNDAVIRAKALDTPQESFPTKLGSHIYKLIEKITL